MHRVFVIQVKILELVLRLWRIYLDRKGVRANTSGDWTAALKRWLLERLDICLLVVLVGMGHKFVPRCLVQTCAHNLGQARGGFLGRYQAYR